MAPPEIPGHAPGSHTKEHSTCTISNPPPNRRFSGAPDWAARVRAKTAVRLCPPFSPAARPGKRPARPSTWKRQFKITAENAKNSKKGVSVRAEVESYLSSGVSVRLGLFSLHLVFSAFFAFFVVSSKCFFLDERLRIGGFEGRRWISPPGPHPVWLVFRPLPSAFICDICG